MRHEQRGFHVRDPPAVREQVPCFRWSGPVMGADERQRQDVQRAADRDRESSA